jgi:hypothetical protein
MACRNRPGELRASDQTKRETIGAQRDDRDDVVAHIRIVLSGGPRVIYNR